MALLNILVYPDSRLRTVAKPVEAVDQSVATLVDDMAQTMYSAPGIGLAATQVNVPKRVIVMDLSENRDELIVFINPIIEALEGEIENNYDFITITSENGAEHRYTGHMNGVSFPATGSSVTVRFESDGSVVKSGVTVSITQ